MATEVAVTATPQKIDVPKEHQQTSITNLGTGEVYLLTNASAAEVTAFAGTASELKAIADVRMRAGDVSILNPSADNMAAACPTGSTATVEVVAGESQARLDIITGAQLAITDAHYEIHEGGAFQVHYSTTTAATDDHRTGIGFKTPNTTKRGHLIVTISTDQPAEFFMVEAPTLTDRTAGTALAILNRNRNSANTSVMSNWEGTPAVNSVSTFTEAQMASLIPSAGTELDHTILAGGRGPRVVGGDSRGTEEWILKANTDYLFYLQNIGANATIQSIHLDWYEHTDLS